MSPAIRRILAIRRGMYLGLGAIITAGVIWAFAAWNGSTSAIVQKDGIIMYGASANTTPQVRDYTSATNTFGSAAGSVAGTQAQALILKTSPIKNEAIAGYVNSSGVLQVMCFNGTSWTNEWTVTVGGTGTTRPFDIAYEKTSGKAMVLYGNNGANLGYRTKPSASACGSANWASASTFTPARTTGTVSWVRLAQDTRSSSNLLAAAWADGASDLSSQVWSGSAWGNEPTSALSTTLEFASAAQDIDSFDIGYESTSGDLMVVFGASGTGTTNLIKYAACTGGTSSCTWAAVANIPTVADAATSIDLGVDPLTDQMGLVAVDNGGGADSCDMSTAIWSGSAWTGAANVDVTVECPTAGQRTATTFWLTSGSTTRRIVTYDDATGTGLSWRTYNGTTNTTQTDFTTTPAINDVRARYTSVVNPFDRSEGMLTIVDSTGMLSVKRLVMDASGNFTWTNANGASSLATVSQAAVGDASFDYWNFIPVTTYTQSAYGWFANANSVQPGSALASENVAYSTSNTATPIRLRTQLTVADVTLPASSQAFRLQYAASTSGPWNDIATDVWWNSSWTARRKITLNNSASTVNLTDFPIRVSLSSSNIDYSKTQNNGEDIRFVDADGTALSYEIETWNESGTSEVWVKVPQIDAGSTTDFIYMYFNNVSATDGQSVSSVWSNGYKGVWHTKESSGTSVADSSGNSNTGTLQNGAAITSSGKIGNANIYDGTNDIMNAGSSASLDNLYAQGNNGMTITAWANTVDSNQWSIIGMKGANANPSNAWVLEVDDSNNRLHASITGNSTNFERSSTASTSYGSWQHYAMTYDHSSSPHTSTNLGMYINGAVTNGGGSGSVTTLDSDAAYDFTSACDLIYNAAECLQGTIDELRVSNLVRSADWIRAEYISTNDAMNSFASEEVYSPGGSGGHAFYDNTSPANGAAITGTLLTGSNVLETYQENAQTAVNPNAIAVGNKGEWDFSFDISGLSVGTYYYRMIKVDGSPLGTYSVYPALTITSNGPTLDQQLRGGQSVINGVKQPFGF